MGECIIVYGKSGTGKSRSLKNFAVLLSGDREASYRSLPYFAAIYRFSVRYFLSRDSLASAAGHMRGSIAGPGSSMF